jgi:hypothetical protein
MENNTVGIKIPSQAEMIVRQSQLQRSIEIFALLGKKPKLRQILRLSQLLVDFQWTDDLNNDDIKKFDKWLESLD